MLELINSLDYEDALILTAPPGWGKTYKLLWAIKKTDRKICFVFPLRALCDEVYLAAQKKNIHSLNIRDCKSLNEIEKIKPKLIVSTPELIMNYELDEYLVILDEFHLFYYWGDSFREKMFEFFIEVTSLGNPIIFLTATLGEELKERLVMDLSYNYKNIIQLNMGNQELKNYPNKIYYYPKINKNFLHDEIFYVKKRTTLIFCQYREEVKSLEDVLLKMGYHVLSCIGGEAKEFVEKLNLTSNLDFIIATSVVSHGVNLPAIKRIIFTYKVNNLDFYLQMVGRGGRDGGDFEIHTMNRDYFSKKLIIYGYLNIFLKRIPNHIRKLLYYAYES